MFASAINTTQVSAPSLLDDTPTLDQYTLYNRRLLPTVLGQKLLCFPSGEWRPSGTSAHSVSTFDQPQRTSDSNLPLWVCLNSYSMLFPDGNHFISQIKGWSLLSLDEFCRGPYYGYASFLRPSKGGHRSWRYWLILHPEQPQNIATIVRGFFAYVVHIIWRLTFMWCMQSHLFLTESLFYQ